MTQNQLACLILFMLFSPFLFIMLPWIIYREYIDPVGKVERLEREALAAQQQLRRQQIAFEKAAGKLKDALPEEGGGP